MMTTYPSPSLTQLPSAASARGLVKSYGSGDAAVHALDGIDLDLAPGRFTAVMGPSGSGKSTLLHCLAGLDQPTAGSVVVDGVELTALTDDELTRFRRDHLGFVFQAFNLLPMLTARQNMLLPLELAGARVDEARERRLREVVEMLRIGDRLDHRPSEMSGGQQQRVAIGRALVGDAHIVFADEPTGNLDSATSAEVLAFLRRGVRDEDRTVIMVTHELDAAAYADDVVVLADGRVRDHLVAPAPEDLVRALSADPAAARTDQEARR